MQQKVVMRIMTEKDDFSAVENLQKRAWGIDDLTTTPAHVLQAACKYDAGFVAVALYDGKIIGFIFSFETKKKVAHHMHMIGVDPIWQGGKQGRNVGEMLCGFYQEYALKQGIEVIEWTFDPLLANNATLYFHKLCAQAIRYEPDAYGQSSEVGIYHGMPTDRLLVRWFLKEPLSRRINLADIPKLHTVTCPEEIKRDIFKLPIPLDIHELKRTNMENACQVRLQTRTIFLKAFKMGYEVKDFIYQREKGENYYIFS